MNVLTRAGNVTRQGWAGGLGGAGEQFVGCRRDATWRARVKTRHRTDGIGVWNASEMRADGMKLSLGRTMTGLTRSVQARRYGGEMNGEVTDGANFGKEADGS